MYYILSASWTRWMQHNTKVRFSPSVRWYLLDEHISCEMDCIIWFGGCQRGDKATEESLIDAFTWAQLCALTPFKDSALPLWGTVGGACESEWCNAQTTSLFMQTPPLTMLQCSISPFVKMKQKMMQVWVLPNTTWIKFIALINWTCMFVIMSMCVVHISYSEALPNNR